MAADANRIAMITSGMYFLYGGMWALSIAVVLVSFFTAAPFEILIAGFFLYQCVSREH